MELIGTLLTDAKNFQLLAEEFFIDPEGSISCLEEILQTRVQARSSVLLPDAPLVTLHTFNSERCIKPTVWFRDEYSSPA
jgi:hypothetical protein